MATRNVFSVLAIVLFLTGVHIRADDSDPIPAELSEVNTWFTRNVLPFPSRLDLSPELATAESIHVVLHVRVDGTGHFQRVTDAIQSIPDGNTKRTIIVIGPGIYTEKIIIERSKPFITLYGDPQNMPTIVFDDTSARVHGTKISATVFVYAHYFTAAHVIFRNSAPRPVGKEGAQAVALTIQGDMASFYGCHFLGFQDTLCDDFGHHFFMDCYIEGTVDFIFGAGSSMYLRTEAHVVAGDDVAYVTAHGREDPGDDSGYSFVHSRVTGTGRTAYLGRPWRPFARVVFAYSELTDTVRPEGWYADSSSASTIYFGEYLNFGPGSTNVSRAPARVLSDVDARRYLTLGYINGSRWLLPPPVMELGRVGLEPPQPPHHSECSVSYSSSIKLIVVALCIMYAVV